MIDLRLLILLILVDIKTTGVQVNFWEIFARRGGKGKNFSLHGKFGSRGGLQNLGWASDFDQSVRM